MADNGTEREGPSFIPYYNEIINMLQGHRDMKKSIKGILHQLVYTAIGVIIGGFLLGPTGAMVCGIIGSVIGYFTVLSYDPVIGLVRDMDEQEKRELCTRVQQHVGSPGIEALVKYVARNVNRDTLVTLVTEFSKHSGNKVD